MYLCPMKTKNKPMANTKPKKEKSKFELNIECLKAAEELYALIPASEEDVKEKPYMQFILSRAPQLGGSKPKISNIRSFMQGRRADAAILKAVKDIIKKERSQKR